MTIPFDSEKALEAFLYVADRVRDHNLYLTLKTLYIAEKLHLTRYGRFIVGDTYIAMEYGPVPSHIYDAAKYARGDRATSPMVGVRQAFAVDDRHQVRRLREPDLDVFSRSDLECLDEAIREYGRLSFGHIRDLSHDAAYEKTPRNQPMDWRDIVAMLPDADALRAHLEQTCLR
jgi:uncharacterized phage-associated protein